MQWAGSHAGGLTMDWFLHDIYYLYIDRILGQFWWTSLPKHYSVPQTKHRNCSVWSILHYRPVRYSIFAISVGTNVMSHMLCVLGVLNVAMDCLCIVVLHYLIAWDRFALLCGELPCCLTWTRFSIDCASLRSSMASGLHVWWWTTHLLMYPGTEAVHSYKSVVLHIW